MLHNCFYLHWFIYTVQMIHTFPGLFGAIVVYLPKLMPGRSSKG